jgi:3-isopropylmalate/(R)-2-methylmalate dehydratase large subunit
MREFVRSQKISHFFDINKGICHQVMPENGLVWPGMILIATDSHTTTHGAFGALGTGVGATDLATILLSGELWLRVPEVINIQINGHLQPGVTAKDVILSIIGSLKQDVAVYKAIEYTGSVISDLSVAGRMVLCNMAVEMGAMTAYIHPDERVLQYIESVTEQEYQVLHTDPEFKYHSIYDFDMNKLVPQVAAPHSIDNVLPVTEVSGIKVNQIFIGSCTNGRLEDIEIAARILDGKQVNSDCRLIVIPASNRVMLEATKAGYVESLLQSGAAFSTPGCGPCLGAHQGVLAPGEVCLTTSSRNFPGRMGSTEAQIYTVSPATAAATSIHGEITDPRKYIKSRKFV